MQIRFHILIWPVVLMIVLGLSMGFGGGTLRSGGERDMAHSPCGKLQKKEDAERKDWGWKIFNIGTVLG